MNDQESFDRANSLDDAARAADLWGKLPAEQRDLDFIALTDLQELNGGQLQRHTLLRLTGNNFTTALEAMGLDGPQDLQFNTGWNWAERLQFKTQPRLDPNGFNPDSYLRMMAKSMDHSQDLLTNGAEVRELMRSAEAEAEQPQMRDKAADYFRWFVGATHDQWQISDLIAEQVKEGPGAEFKPLAEMTVTEQLEALQEVVSAASSVAHPILRDQAHEYLDSTLQHNLHHSRHPENTRLDMYNLPDLAAARTILDLDRRWQERRRQDP